MNQRYFTKITKSQFFTELALNRSEDSNKGTERVVDVLDESAMENALNICHNVQVRSRPVADSIAAEAVVVVVKMPLKLLLLLL